jgi:hypothetical protein
VAASPAKRVLLHWNALWMDGNGSWRTREMRQPSDHNVLKHSVRGSNVARALLAPHHLRAVDIGCEIRESNVSLSTAVTTMVGAGSPARTVGTGCRS